MRSSVGRRLKEAEKVWSRALRANCERKACTSQIKNAPIPPPVSPCNRSVTADEVFGKDNSWSATKVDIGWGEITQAFVVTPGVVEVDELGQSGFHLSRQIVVFEQDPVLK